MSKLMEAEMQLVAELDDSPEDSMGSYVDRKKHSAQSENKAEAISRSSVNGKIPGIKRYRFFNNPDPVFYVTCLICSGLLFVGTYFFVDRSNRMVMAHLQKIETGNKEVSEQLMRRVSSADSLASSKDPIQQDKNPDEKAPSVQVQSTAGNGAAIELASQSSDGAAAAVTPKAKVPSLVSSSNPAREKVTAISSSVDPDLRFTETASNLQDIRAPLIESNGLMPSLDSNADVKSEIARLQSSLSEKAEQLELLALENYELRLQIEFEGTERRSKDPGADSDEAAIIPDQSAFTADEPPIQDTVSTVEVSSSSGTEPTIDRLRQLLRLNPDDLKVFSQMVNLATPENDMVAELFAHVSRASAKRPVMYSLLGNHFAFLDQWVVANNAFKAAKESSLSPSAEVLFNLAVSYEHLGQSQHALESYSLALGAADNARVDRMLVQSRLRELAP